MIKRTFWIGLCLLAANFLFSQIEDTRKINFYEEFGSNPELLFLKEVDLGNLIFEAKFRENAQALGAYAGILFHAERLSGKKASVTGVHVLEAATDIALEEEDEVVLDHLLKIWEDAYFGPGDLEKSQGIRMYFEEQKEKKQAEKSSQRNISIIPNWQEVPILGEITFRVVYADSPDYEIPLEELEFSAIHGRFWSFLKNRYVAPNFFCHDIVHVKHIVTGKTASAIISVKQRETKADAKIEELLDSPYTIDNTKTSLPASQFFSSKDAQNFLRKEESARLQARENMVKEMKRILSFLAKNDKNFQTIVDSFSLSQQMFLAGVKTGNPYVYKEDTSKLRVKASVSKKWAVESIRRHCERRQIIFSENMKQQLEKALEKISGPEIEVEGYVSF